jgi:hypothetical protein
MITIRKIASHQDLKIRMNITGDRHRKIVRQIRANACVDSWQRMRNPPANNRRPARRLHPI